MKAHKIFGSSKLILIALLLLGGLTVSAVTYADSILLPLGVASEGSVFAGLFAPAILAPAAPVVGGPTVSTDQDDYSPGEIVQISGSGFRPGEVTLQIVHVEPVSALKAASADSLSDYDHAGHEPWTVNVAADGTFSSSWLVEPASLNKTLLLTADQPASDGLEALHAEKTFTDGSIGTYDQCSNDSGNGYPNGNPPEGCKWINGNLNGNNSTYPEGTSTVQRVELTGFGPNEEHSVTFQYGTSKNGRHSYDFLTRWDWSEKWITVADRCEGLINGCEAAPEAAAAIPVDINLPANWETDSVSPTAPDTPHQFVMRGATFSLVNTPAVTPPQFQDPNMTYAGTSETLITVKFKTPAAGSPMCSTKSGVTTCNVAIWFGAHVAKTVDWLAFNNTTGAGSISGSPYHVALFRLDDLAIGNRDNQMQASAVTSQSLEVVKVLSPSTDAGRFDLLIDTGTLNAIETPNQGDGGTTGAREVGVGNHTVGEAGGDNPVTDMANYTTTLSCVTTPATGSVTTQNFGDVTGNLTRQVTVPENGDVVCTYTNTLRTGSIQIVKETVGGVAGQTYPWGFTPVGFNGGSVINFSTSGVNGTNSSSVYSNLPASGTYSVTESSLPSGWQFTSAVCRIDGGQVSRVGTNVSLNIPVQIGKTTICTYRNSRIDDIFGRIIVHKDVIPDGDSTQFEFTTSGYTSQDASTTGTNPFTLGDNGVDNSCGASLNCLDPGTYGVAETANSSYTTASYCTPDGGTTIYNAASFSVGAGETVHCYFTNTRNTGSLKLLKALTGGPAGYTGPFTIAYDCNDGTAHDGSAGLNVGQTFTVSGIPTGTQCTVSETPPTPPTGYTFGTPTFSPQATVTIANKDVTVEVTTNNSLTRDLGNLKAVKFHDLDADGTDDGGTDPKLENWTFFVDLSGDSIYQVGEPTGNTNSSGEVPFTNLPTGSYSVCEIQKTDWFNSKPGSSAAVVCQSATVLKNTTTTVTFGNFQKTDVKVIKTVNSLAPLAADGNIAFTIRTGASTEPGATGTTVTGGSGVANAGNGGIIEFNVALSPGKYQMCEVVPVGYDTSVKNVDWDGDGTPGEYGDDWFYPGININDATSTLDNGTVCFNFTVVSGSDTAGDGLDRTLVFTIDNGRPGMQRTIGFWKNHASCASSKGGQDPVLDQTLAKAPNGGIWEGDVFVDTCNEAVSLLSKTTIGTTKKAGKQMSSDPAFNSAAQHVAFQLNVLIPSTVTCSSANQAADLIQDYLDQVGFTGQPWTFNWSSGINPKVGANLNFLSTLLDHYNNDTLDNGYSSSSGTISCITNAASAMPYPSQLPTANNHDSLPQ
ncbi:MAG: DUF5979 domain-containing protein [Pyrinomonadaceae bacterium]